jgi:large subunit ribosomal protein L25
MTQIIPLSAELRDRAGKGTARATRRSGRIPAVIYGAKQPPVMLTLDARSFIRVLHQPGFFTHLFDVAAGEETHRVLARDVQFHPVTDVPLHVDFLRVSGDTRITLNVPVEFVGQDKSPGIKRGGVLNIVAHEIEITCAADAIPEHIVISLEGVDLGGSIHMSSVKLPEGAKTTDTHDFTVASIATPSGLRSEEAGAAEAGSAD